jgi:hypothetical protein
VNVEFYSVPGPTGVAAVGIFERGSAFAATSPTATLIAQSLTSQEIYLALAGPGAVAPRELVDAQATEAAQLGRTPDLRIVPFDRNPPIVNKDLTACRNTLFSADLSSWAGGSSGWFTGPSGYYSNSCSTLLGIDSSYAVGIGGCNEGGGTEMFYQLIQGDWPPNYPTLQGFGTYLGGYQYGMWYWRYYFYTGGHLYGASYDFGGALGDPNACGPIDLVSGYWMPKPQ